MRNRFLKLLFFFLISKISYADNLDISAKNISIDKKNEITILKDNVIIRDTKGNIIKTEIANYNKKKEVIISSGKTSILTSEGYLVETKDLVFDNFRGLSSSEKKTTIKDPENNLIYLIFHGLTGPFYAKTFLNQLGKLKSLIIQKIPMNFHSYTLMKKKER